MPQEVKVRFAPSPTGSLHVGNARVAILNWLLARHHEGVFLLRMDDTDRERSTKAFEEGIYEDLHWLGLDWDEFFRQSNRQERYDAAVEKLKEMGRLYPCYETQEELELKRKIQLGRGQPPVYDRSALALSDAEKSALEAAGRTPHWRFKLEDTPVVWDDLGRGEVRFEPGHLSDPVLIREDGRPLYTLSSVVDDGESDITHILRGEDHVVNTAVQVQLFEALGFTVPRFAHMPLMMGADGKQLSKRLGSLSLKELREEGIEPSAVAAYLAHLGTPVAPTGEETLDTLAPAFDLAQFGRAAPRYDAQELAHLNAKVLHHLPFEAVKDRLMAMGVTGANPAFWQAVRGNLERLSDARIWWNVVDGDIDPVVAEEDRAFVSAAGDLLPEEPWDGQTFKVWADRLKSETGRKGKTLFMPLRLALTGERHGPDLGEILPMIGRERVIRRLGNDTA